MKKIGFIILCIIVLNGCKNKEMSASTEDKAFQQEPTILAMEIQVEKISEADDMKVLRMSTDTLKQASAPLPTNNDLPDIFKVEVLNSSNKIVFSSKYKTSFSEIDGLEIANIKFFCPLTKDAVKAKVYYQISDGVWKQVSEYEL